MTWLAPRLFPHRIVRRRQEPGTTNTFGEFVPGGVIEKEFPASVQPLSLDDADTVGGVSLLERWIVFTPEPDALRAAFEDREADHVVVFSTTFVVEESRSWPGAFTRATVLRET